MNPRTLLQRHHALRWLAPVGVVAVAVVVTTGIFEPDAPAARKLPRTSPASLVADLQSSPTAQFTGTVVSTFSLGLPELPDIGTVGDGSSFTSLLSGSHTMQVWYGGTSRERVALFGSTDETDVFRNGRSVWQWSSASRSAVHIVLPAGDDVLSPLVGTSGPTAITPSSVASTAVNDLPASTSVSVDKGHQIADRSTYDLTLTPHDASTRVAKVRISVDGSTKVPLGVKVYARGDDDPAIDVEFTSIRFTHPAARNFNFTPPSDARIRRIHLKRDVAQPSQPASSGHAATSGAASGTPSAPGRSAGSGTSGRVVQEFGTGWSRVVGTQLPDDAARAIRRSHLYDALRPVSGSWGKGRVLDSNLLSVLITQHGRVLVGPVDPNVLYAYAGEK